MAPDTAVLHRRDEFIMARSTGYRSGRRSLMGSIAYHNPFYLLSAACMLLACLLLSNTMTWSPIASQKLIMLIVTLNLYELILVAFGLYLIAQRNLRRDGTMLLFLEAFCYAKRTIAAARTRGVPAEAGAMADVDDVLITSEVEKLPPEFAALIDARLPLPIGVQFYEKRYTVGDMITTIAWALGLGALGMICTLFGIAFAISTLGDQYQTGSSYGVLAFGLVCIFAAVLMFNSLRTRNAARKLQLAGRSSRMGTYLTPTTLFQATEHDYLVLPRDSFRGRSNATVKYVFEGQDKSFALPGALVNATPEERDAAIDAWAAS